MTADLEHIRVRDAMHHGILSCTGDAPLGEVAGIMAKHHVHAVAIANGDGTRPLGIVSDLDVVAAAASGEDPSALQAAATEPLAVSADERLPRAAQLMAEHGVSHLVVLDAASGHPIGVLSTIDIATVYAGSCSGPRLDDGVRPVRADYGAPG
jgi:CBS domain-containing protein